MVNSAGLKDKIEIIPKKSQNIKDNAPEYVVDKGGKDGEKAGGGDCGQHEAGVIHPGEGVHTWAGKIFVSLWKVKLDNEKHLGRRNDRPEFEEHWDKEDSGSPGKEEQLFANKSGINL